MLLALFALKKHPFFQIGCLLFALAFMDHNPIYVSCIAGMAGAGHHTHLLAKMESC
jgi:hypothetical protein